MKMLSKMAYRQLRYQQWSQRFLRPGLLPVGVVLLLFSLVMLLSACTNPLATPSQSGGSSVDTTNSAATPTSPAVSATPIYTPPVITLQLAGCPSNLSLNWDKLVGTHPNVDKVQKVICGSLEGSGTLDALVDVRYYSPDAKLDVYVYDNLFGTPNRRFSVQGLLSGNAQISLVNTITTAEVGPKDIIQGRQDLFKEYQWNGTTFAQILFPGIYPDVTRYQAEQAQALVSSELATLQPGQSQGQIHDAWRLSSLGVVTHAAQTIFHWQPTKYTVTLPAHASQLSILSIVVTNLAPGGGGFVAIVHHLNEVPTNIFEVWQINSIDGNIWLSNPTAYAHLTSPASISGGSLANGGILGHVVLYDDLYIQVGDSGSIHSSASSGYVQFTNAVSYHLNAQGFEEGVVAFYSTNQNNTTLSNQVILVKVLLSA